MFRTFSVAFLHDDWFWQKNKGNSDDGFGLLPEHVRAGLESKTPSAFLRFPLREPKKVQIEPVHQFLCIYVVVV
jgi:hypothetical protein